MPAGDKTGPLGLGPMTGRQAGYCTGYNAPGYANSTSRGFFRGVGCGFGWRRLESVPTERVVPVQNIPTTQPQQPTKEQEITMLENNAKVIEDQQKALNQELEEIKKKIEELI